MRAITERLTFGTSARTPIIATGHDGLNSGEFLGNDGFAHNIFK